MTLIKYSNQRLALLVIFSFLSINFSFGQCTHSVTSLNGYTVEITLTPTNVIAPSSCPWGYSFTVETQYDISFTGSNQPGSLNAMHAYLDCDSNPGMYFDLPNSGGTGMRTPGSYRNNTDCATATVESIGCDNIDIEIEGPGIPNHTISCPVASALPIELVRFEAIEKSGKIELHWETATELNNDYFLIQRSPDGTDWKTLNKVPGVGNSGISSLYKSIDENPFSGISFYRLKQVDFDGTEKYFDAVSIQITDSVLDIELFPNPAGSFITISNHNSEETNYQIFNLVGKRVDNKVKFINTSGNELGLDISRLPTGTYLLKTASVVKKFNKI